MNIFCENLKDNNETTCVFDLNLFNVILVIVKRGINNVIVSLLAAVF